MNNDRPITRILVALAVVGLAGCAGPAASAPPSTAGPAAAASSPTAATQPIAASRDAWLVVGRRGEAGFEVIQASTAENQYTLPSGVPDERWGHLFSAVSDGDRTTITHLAVQPGFGGPATVIEGRWRLPTIGLDPTPVGLSANAAESPNAATVVLVEDGPPDASRATTRFAVVRRTPIGEPLTRVVELAGAFEYDALSPDGSLLYVVEHLGGKPEGRYQVRVVDVSTGVMRDTIIADKRNLEEAMSGWPIAQIRRPDGIVMTLYRGAEHPFIHALNTREAWAVCIDLPSAQAEDAEAALDWGVAAAPDGQAVYAVNATLGLAVDVNPTELTVRQSATVKPLAASSGIVLAKFGHADAGPVGRRVVVSPDGRTILAAGATGILAIEAKSLTTSRRLLDGHAVGGLGLRPDGTTIYALDSGSGRIVALDALTGEIAGEVPGDGFDRLLAVVPW
jgi:hypothetical protein